MDNRRLSYASVAGGDAGASASNSGRMVRHLYNPSRLSTTMNEPYYFPAATSERINVPSPIQDNSKPTQAHGWSTSSVFRKTEEVPYIMERTMLIRPSYLNGSNYLARLDAHYHARVSRQLVNRTPSLSKSSSVTSLHRMAPSHRGMTYEIVENKTAEIDDDLTPPLPSKWGEKDKNGGLEILGNTEVKYLGAGKSHERDAAATRTDNPIPRRCGVYYYEVTVLSKGRDGTIAIGFSTPKASLEKLPGWEHESWGYHGDDGKAFGCGQAGRNYGPVFTVDDVIGCGIIFKTGEVFFTKNGIFLDFAFRDLRETINRKKVYASVGMKRPGGHVRVNFGQANFEFDIDAFVNDQRKLVQGEILKQDIGKLHPKHNSTDLVAELISQHLRYDGFIETAESFAAEVAQEAASLRQETHTSKPQNTQQDINAINRQKIRSAILDGNIDLALELTQVQYPAVLETNPRILFQLKCRKFVEMMRSPTVSTSQMDEHSQKPRSPSGNDMDIDDQHVLNGSNGGDTFSSDTAAANRLQQALMYAQELRAEYRSDSNKETSQALNEIFALFAYEDPRNSPAAGLMDVAGRLPVAETLNSAILISLGAPSTTSLETIYQQTQSILEDTIEHGGSGGLINLDRNIDRAIADPNMTNSLPQLPPLPVSYSLAL